MKSFKNMSIWKVSGSLIGLLALLAILVGVNLLFGVFRGARVDLTEDRLYTLSPGTHAVLDKLDEPVTLMFFFNRSSPEVPQPLKLFATQVEDLLGEYVIAERGRVALEKYDPKPDSEIEDLAVSHGISKQQLGMMGPSVFMGLVVRVGDREAAIPFIDPRAEELLEYNFTRLIAQVASPKKPVLGVMSSLPVLGTQPSSPYSMPGQRPPAAQPPWVVFKDLKETCNVREVPMNVEKIDRDMDALMLVHPKNLSDRTLYAIDQFVLGGGRLIAFVDPICIADINQQQSSMNMMMGPRGASDINRLTSAWGIRMDSTRLVADMNSSTQIRRGPAEVEDSPVFLSLREDRCSKSDVSCAQIKYMVLPLAGCFTGEVANGLSLTPLVFTSRDSDMVSSFAMQIGADAIREQFKSRDQIFNIAVRIQGDFKTAFPDGRPAAAPADPANPDKPDATPAPAEPDPDFLKESTGKGAVVLVGDVDMLCDAYTVQELEFFGNIAYQPANDNMAFALNQVDMAIGSPELMAVRSRGRVDRSFDRVRDLAGEAQKKYDAQERLIQSRLAEVTQKLEALQSTKDKSQRYVLSPDQKKEIERFRKDQTAYQRQLRDIRKNLREGIETLGVWVKLLTIVVMPCIVILAGVLLHLYRRAKLRAT